MYPAIIFKTCIDVKTVTEITEISKLAWFLRDIIAAMNKIIKLKSRLLIISGISFYPTICRHVYYLRN